MPVQIDPAPVFTRLQVRMYGPSRVELAPPFMEIERAREKFSFTYLPQEVAALCKEALACFSAGAFNAIACMCRRAAQAVFAALGEGGKLRVFDELDTTRDLAGLTAETYGKLKTILLRSRHRPGPTSLPVTPAIRSSQAAARRYPGVAATTDCPESRPCHPSSSPGLQPPFRQPPGATGPLWTPMAWTSC